MALKTSVLDSNSRRSEEKCLENLKRLHDKHSVGDSCLGRSAYLIVSRMLLNRNVLCKPSRILNVSIFSSCSLRTNFPESTTNTIGGICCLSNTVFTRWSRYIFVTISRWTSYALYVVGKPFTYSSKVICASKQVLLPYPRSSSIFAIIIMVICLVES